MDFSLLRRFLIKAAAASTDIELQQQMLGLHNQLAPAAMDSDVPAPELTKATPDSNQAQPQQLEDMLLTSAMPELAQKTPEELGTFGRLGAKPMKKTSALLALKRTKQLKVKLGAYIKDVCLSSLPPTVQKDVRRFVTMNVKDPCVIHYGLTVRELEGRADPQNYKNAQATVAAETKELGRKEEAAKKDEVYAKIPSKYILMVNDTIVDGHHFLAKARRFGISCSLNVLDLTPSRFQ